MKAREWVHGLKSGLKSDSVLLLSGGLDSCTVLGIARSEGLTPVALSFSYGQRHSRELDSARKVASHFGVEHVIVGVDLGKTGGSSLTDANIEVEHRNIAEIGTRMPSSYVPARNSVFLSVAFGLAESLGVSRVFIGANSLDYSGYPDCRQEYFNAMEKALNLGTSDAKPVEIRISAPLIRLSKKEIIQRGMSLGVPYSMTWSCYEGGDKACGLCDSCILRLKGFAEAGYEDPLEYREYPEFYTDFLKKR